MSDLDSFYKHLELHPDDHGARLRFADWLEERSSVEPCPQCGGDGRVKFPDGGRIDSGNPFVVLCSPCSGTGSVPDRWGLLATGYRALGMYGRRAWEAGNGRFTWTKGGNLHTFASNIPQGWYAALRAGVMRDFMSDFCRSYDTRREAEDDLATAYSLLSPAARAAVAGELGKATKDLKTVETESV